MKHAKLFLLLLFAGYTAFGQGSKRILIVDNVLLKPIRCKLVIRKNNKETELGQNDVNGYITIPCGNADSIKAIPNDIIRFYNSQYYICGNLSDKIMISNRYQYAVLNKKIDSVVLKKDYLSAALYYNVLYTSYKSIDSGATANIYQRLSYQALAQHFKIDQSIQYEINSPQFKMSDKLKGALINIQQQNGSISKVDEKGNLVLDNRTLQILVGKPKFDSALQGVAVIQ
ncbi:hypothetical protein SAMN05192574_104353 [Mucilaginibacter gossypiicola]|uniref:Uncharacterized protein n=1 Tax=Mucilaginibacter gossypiicola TaxID=551995 RepID=A0A1H8JXB4_9SPHI|nr:hypothetical protein [Mucilaginibacter gossypiicola]SEN85155.1 hypothetical protein SAMN05192574_104353 [Mucilaginibacter gossypiicola]